MLTLKINCFIGDTAESSFFRLKPGPVHLLPGLTEKEAYLVVDRLNEIVAKIQMDRIKAAAEE